VRCVGMPRGMTRPLTLSSEAPDSHLIQIWSRSRAATPMEPSGLVGASVSTRHTTIQSPLQQSRGDRFVARYAAAIDLLLVLDRLRTAAAGTPKIEASLHAHYGVSTRHTEKALSQIALEHWENAAKAKPPAVYANARKCKAPCVSTRHTLTL
jgi:hypothetical protein